MKRMEVILMKIWLQWLGHVHRMDDRQILRQAFHGSQKMAKEDLEGAGSPEVTR